MARVFISHSSRDNEPAARIKAWLAEQGFETPFLDYDKHAGIPPGADWEKTLYREIERSEAIVIIQTPNWLDSKWCFAEFTQARALGKSIFPIIETPTGDTLISPDIQALDLRKDREGGLEQLSSELTRIALDAQGGFPWDASRPPYPGLLAFQEEDAALYFGRDDDIRRLIERLNARRAQGGTKLIALLGASGSGKSSLLRAGVIPRLKRAGHNWVVLPPMRPQVRPVDELARSLAVACGGDADWRKLREDLNGDNLALTLSDIANDLRTKAAANEAQILLPIDQAEELFGAADPDQALRFFEILNVALASDLPFIAVMALRSDYLGLLQSAERLTARFEEFSLGPMPLARIPQIIEGPARVAGLGIDEAFVHQAARDAETEDALPLLAFALRELYDRASDDNYLSLDEYSALGDPKEGLTPLENAVRKAADDVLAEARPGKEELTALREAFVPAMVRVNEQGEYVRRPAHWDELPNKAHPLLERLAKARLLIVSQDGEDRMVEVAHEALLRKWPRLRGWLDDAREFLTGKQQLERDLHDWEHAAEVDKSAALLTGLKLARARGWLLERPHQLTAEERALIKASIDHAEAEERRRARLRRNITRGSIAAALVLAGVAIFAGFQYLQANKAANELELKADELERAARERAVELIHFTWVDLGAKQDEVQRLTEVAGQLQVKPDALLPNILEQTQPDGFDCQTSLESGFRQLYCSIRSVVGFRKMQSISGLSIFRPGGPHEDEVNLSDKRRFGHYNPEFLTWLDDYIIPEGRDDAQFNRLTQLVYKTHVGPISRALYNTHEILFANPEDYRAFEKRFQFVKNEHMEGRGPRADTLSPEDKPIPFEGIKKDYLERTQSAGGPGPIYLQERFRWLSDYLTADKGDDWYLANTAGGFWVRRSIDGTEAHVFSLLKKLLNTFEPEVLGK